MLKSTITAVTVELIFSVLFDLVGFGFTGRPEVLGMSLALPHEDEGKRAVGSFADEAHLVDLQDLAHVTPSPHGR